MSIPERLHEPFEALGLAGIEGRLALMECIDRETGLPVFVVCAAYHTDDEVLMAPVAILPDYDMFERIEPPMGGTWDHYGDLDTETPT